MRNVAYRYVESELVTLEEVLWKINWVRYYFYWPFLLSIPNSTNIPLVIRLHSFHCKEIILNAARRPTEEGRNKHHELIWSIFIKLYFIYSSLHWSIYAHNLAIKCRKLSFSIIIWFAIEIINKYLLNISLNYYYAKKVKNISIDSSCRNQLLHIHFAWLHNIHYIC